MISTCSSCFKENEVDEDLVGSEVECSNCGKGYLVKAKLKLKTHSNTGVSLKKFDNVDNIQNKNSNSNIKNNLDYDNDDEEETIFKPKQKNKKEVNSIKKPLLCLIGIFLLSFPIAGLLMFLGGLLATVLPIGLFVILTPVFLVLVGGLPVFSYNAIFIFITTKLIGPNDTPAKTAFSAALKVYVCFIVIYILGAVLMLAIMRVGAFSAGSISLIWIISVTAPIILPFLIPTIVYKGKFFINFVHALVLTIVQYILTIITTLILGVILFVGLWLFFLIIGSSINITDFVKDNISEIDFISNESIEEEIENRNNLFNFQTPDGMNATIKFSNYNSYDKNSYDGKGVPHIKDFARTKDIIKLFNSDGLYANKGINEKNLYKIQSSGKWAFKELKIGKDTIKFCSYPMHENQRKISSGYLSIDFAYNNEKNYKKSLKKFISMSEKLSKCMLSSKLPKKIIDALNKYTIKSGNNSFSFYNGECKIGLQVWNSSIDIDISYDTITCYDYK